MKRIFNKSNQQPAATSYQSAEELSNLPPLAQSGSYSRPQSSRPEDQYRSSRPTSPLKRSGGRAAADTSRSRYSHSPEQSYTSAASTPPIRTGKQSKAGAYPSYGEVQLDSNDNRGGGQVSRHTNEPLEAVVHQKLPARSQVPRSTHNRSQSDARQQDLYSPGLDSNSSSQLYNPHSRTRDHGVERHSSVSRGPPKVRNALQNLNRRASQTQSRGYRDEPSEKLSRRPSLLYGIDSGVHGGYASAAMASADEQDRQSASNHGRARDPNVIQPEARYVDQYIDVRTPQSVAIANGMDKVKRRLFGGKKRRDGVEIEEGEKESSGEWARVDQPAPADRQEYYPANAEDERSAEPGNGHTTWHANRKQSGKGKEESITSHISSLCLGDEDEWDWNQIQYLCNAISHSEIASKESAKAFRKEFKADEKQRYGAVRLWAIVCTRAGDRFRLQVASKKFIEALEDLYFDKKTTTRLRGRLLMAWGMLAHEFQQDQDLLPITKMFNKVSPNEMPINGTPLDSSHELFTPPSFSNGQQQRSQHDQQQQQQQNQQQPSQHQQHQQQRGPVAADPYGRNVYRDQPADNIDVRRPKYETYPREQRYTPPPPPVPTEIVSAAPPPLQRSAAETPESNTSEEDLQEVPHLSDDIRRLHEECSVARGNAQLMTDALIEHGLSSELVTEFAAKTQQSLDYIESQIPWASALADRSRSERQSWMAGRVTDENTEEQRSKEEMLMEDLLDTHTKLISANSMITEARERQREDDEERQAIDQSIREQRMDRSTLVQETATGQLYSVQSNGLAPPSVDGASSSRSASPIPPVIRRPLPVPGEMNKSAANQSPQSRESEDQLKPLHSPSASFLGGPRPMNDKLNDRSNDRNEEADDSGSIIMTPIAPSAKALGKRRAMSIRESLSPSISIDINNNTSNNNSSTQLADQVSNISINEETLRARPPPALPNPPIIPSTNPFYQ
jgi:hypothetical protein